MLLPLFWFVLVVNVALPLKVPAPGGANVIVAEAAFPACTVSGRTRLLIENPAPLNVACVMVTSFPPLFERVTALAWWPPTLVFPKAIGEGLADSFPFATAPAARLWQPLSSNRPPIITREVAKRRYNR